MHLIDLEFNLIKLGQVRKHVQKVVTSRETICSVHIFTSFLPHTGRRAHRQQCARGSAGKPRLSAFGAFLRLRELGKEGGGGADGSSDHPTTSRHFLGLLPPLPLTQSRKIDDRPTAQCGKVTCQNLVQSSSHIAFSSTIDGITTEY
jgi:hypothetical protein